MLFFLMFTALANGQTDKPLQVVSSIKPVQLLVAAIAGDKLDSALLLPATTSPHLYQLRPSDRQLLASADKVFWMGPDLERFLVKPLSLLDDGVSEALQNSPGIEALAESDNDKHGHHHHGHDHHDGDPHSWLNPMNAVAMAAQIAEELGQLDGQNKLYYQSRLTTFRKRMQALDHDIKTQFENVGHTGYLVLHDAYNHFEQRYGLQHKAAVTVNPDRKPGAKRLQKIQRLFDSGEVRCVFEEPQYQQSALSKMLQQADVAKGLLDPLAIHAVVSVKGYEQFMRDFSKAFYDCLHTQ